MPPKAASTSTAQPSAELAEARAQLDASHTRQTELEQTIAGLRDDLARLASSQQAEDQDRARRETSATTEPVANIQVGTTSTADRQASLAPSHQTTTTNGGRAPEPKVASPEYYAGQRHKVKSFITQVTMVIALQPSRFTSEESKVLYTGSFLRDTAFLWFEPFVNSMASHAFMQNFHLFCDELRRTFGDPDEVGTAERELYALRQKTSVAAYLADFMRSAVLVKWNDEAKAAQFYRGLKDTIKDELARTGRPSSLKELQQAAIRIDTRLYERYVERGGTTVTTNTNRASTQPLRTTSTFTRTQTTFPRHQNHLRAVVQPVRTNFTKGGKLTPAEYQRRKDNHLCLYCGDKGHSVAQCPKAPARDARPGNALRIAKVGKAVPQQGKA